MAIAFCCDFYWCYFCGRADGILDFRHTELHLPIRNQAATVKLPDAIQATAKITNDLNILVKGELSTQVPIQQTIQVPIHETLHTIISFDNDVPIKMNVPLQGQYPAMIRMDTHIPIQFMLAYQDTVHVKTYIDIEGSTEPPVSLLIHESHIEFALKHLASSSIAFFAAYLTGQDSATH